MKIALLAHTHFALGQPYYGGLEMHTTLLADELAERGYEIDVFCKNGSTLKANIIPIISENFIWNDTKDSLENLEQDRTLEHSYWEAFETIASDGYDVLINNSLHWLPYSLTSFIPTLSILHTPPLPEVVKTLQTRQEPLHSHHKIISVSDFNKQNWENCFENIEVIHNGIMLSDWERKVPLSNKAVWAARITPEKGLHDAIVAAKKANIGLDFAGPISDQKYFQEEIVPLIDETICYVGHLDHEKLADLVASAQVFLATPLWDEPFGLSVVEAMASGTPVAAYNAGALWEVMGAGPKIMPQKNDPEHLSKIIPEVIKLSREKVKKFAQRYSHEVMVESYENMLKEIS